jgi:hypothetical protein
MKFKTFVVTIKMYLQRVNGYFSVINTCLIIYLFFVAKGYNVTNYALLIVIGTLLLFVGVGYLEDKMGYYEEDCRIQHARNPHMMKIKENTDEILEELKWR